MGLAEIPIKGLSKSTIFLVGALMRLAQKRRMDLQL